MRTKSHPAQSSTVLTRSSIIASTIDRLGQMRTGMPSSGIPVPLLLLLLTTGDQYDHLKKFQVMLLPIGAGSIPLRALLYAAMVGLAYNGRPQ